MRRLLCLGLCLALAPASFAYQAEVITNKLSSPWSLAFLPDGGFLVTEKKGNLRRVSAAGKVSAPIKGVPEVDKVGQGGLLEVALHPDFVNQPWVYLSYSAGSRRGYNTEVIRAKLEGGQLTGLQKLFVAEPKTGGGRHFGGRLLFDNEGYLFISLGDRGDRYEAQDPSNHIGSLVRLHDDGRIPADNPFVNKSGHRPEIYSYGHRNIQGMALHPQTGKVWTHEHGPQGGDEVNLIQPGKNYGWPVITYGGEYGTGFKIGEGTTKPGLEQPQHYWNPSIAPSGMAFYKDDLLVGALKYQLVARLDLQGDKIVQESRHFEQEWGRIRDVRAREENGESVVYLLTDSGKGRLIRITGF